MKHIFILRLIRKEDGSLISERDMDTMAEKDKDEAVNELNGNSVGYVKRIHTGMMQCGKGVSGPRNSCIQYAVWGQLQDFLE